MAEIKDIIGEDEKVVEVIYRHWISVVPSMIAWVFLGFLSILGFYVLGFYGDQIDSSFAAAIALSALIILSLIFIYVSYWIYRQNRLIITYNSAYLVTQTTLFSRQIDQFGMHRLQEATATQAGFFATVMDFGDVIAETAGDEKNMVFKYARAPRELAERIMDYHRKFTPDSHPHQNVPQPDNSAGL